MFLKTLIAAIFIVFTVNFAHAQNQTHTKKNTVHLEAGGHGLFYSINYERDILDFKKVDISAQIGAAYYPKNTGIIELWLPIMLNTKWKTKERQAIEFSVGLTPNFDHVQSIGEKPVETLPAGRKIERFYNMRLGYRWDSKNDNWTWRAGFTPTAEFYNYKGLPLQDKLSVYPLVAVSIGRRF